MLAGRFQVKSALSGSIVEVTKPFCEVNTKMQLEINQRKNYDWRLLIHNIDESKLFARPNYIAFSGELH
jgi:hypothetical protein